MLSRRTQHQTLWWLSALSGFNHAVVSLGMVVLAPVILKSHFFVVLMHFSTADKLKLLGLLLAVKPACEALTAFICSRLSLSSVRTILFACFSLILFALGLFASALMSGYLSLLFVAQAVFGVGGAVIYLIETVISQAVEQHLQARAFNLLEWSIGLGLLLGPIVGTWLSHIGGWHPQIAYAGFVVVGLLIFLLARQRIVIAASQKKTALPGQSRVTVLDYVAWFCFMSGWHGYFHWFPVLLVHRLHYSTQAMGNVFTLMGVCYVFCQFVVVRRFTYLKSHLSILLCAIPVVALTIALMPFSHSVIMLSILLFFYMLAISFVLPFWKAYLSARAANNQAQVFALMTVMMTSTSILASVSGGFLSAHSLLLTFSLSALFLLIAAACLGFNALLVNAKASQCQYAVD